MHVKHGSWIPPTGEPLEYPLLGMFGCTQTFEAVGIATEVLAVVVLSFVLVLSVVVAVHV